MYKRKRVYGGSKASKKKYTGSVKAIKYLKGTGVSATGPFQTLRLKEELGTFFSNNSAYVGLGGVDTCAWLLNNIIAGTSYNGRHSPSVLNKSIEINFSLMPGIGQITNRTVRIMLVYDKQANGTVINPAFLLNTDLPWGFLEPPLADRFTILYTELFQVGIYGVGEPGYARNVYRKCSLQTTYEGEAGTIADIETGALYFIAMSTTAISGSTQPVFELSSKIRFMK